MDKKVVIEIVVEIVFVSSLFFAGYWYHDATAINTCHDRCVGFLKEIDFKCLQANSINFSTFVEERLNNDTIQIYKGS